MKILKKLMFLIIIIQLSYSCTVFKKKDDDTSDVSKITKKERVNPNVNERMEENRNKTGGIFSSSKPKDPLQNISVLWRASLEAIDFIPIQTASYNGGLIVTEWYGDQKNMIKLTINIISNEISPMSIKVKSQKKECDKQNNCKILEGDKNFESKIKDGIFQKVREISVANQ